MDIVERFIRYTKINTTTIPNAGVMPSSEGQRILAKLLADELKEMGLTNIKLRDNAILSATLLPNTKRKCKTISFCAHLDTSNEYQTDTKAQILTYTGGDLVLNKEKGISIKRDDFPELDRYINEEIICTDGTSLLGADNKSAIAEIMNALESIIDSKTEHGEVQVAFVPDEEQGLLGAKALDIKEFNADFCYTLDCGPLGEIVYENWNASVCRLTFLGESAHPMSAKGKLKNSLLYAHKFISLLPGGEVPEYTENKEGYFWVKSMNGASGKTELTLDIRDFDKKSFEKRKKDIELAVDYFNSKYGDKTVSVSFNDKYFNVFDSLQDKNSFPIELALKAMKNLGISPKPLAMRGGYDGASFSQRGLPTPNLFCGAHNFHSIYEFLPVNSLKKASQMVEELVKLTLELEK